MICDRTFVALEWRPVLHNSGHAAFLREAFPLSECVSGRGHALLGSTAPKLPPKLLIC